MEVGKGGVEKRAEAEGVKTVQEVEGGACGTFWAFRIVILWPRTIFICSRSSSEMVFRSSAVTHSSESLFKVSENFGVDPRPMDER